MKVSYCIGGSIVINLILLDPTFWGHLQRQVVREHGENEDIQDVTDGLQYIKHKQFLSEPAHMSLLLNTDGVSLFRSLSTSLWPIWLAINELPPDVR